MLRRRVGHEKASDRANPERDKPVDPEVAQERGRLSPSIRRRRPAGSVSVCLGQMGPEAAKSYRGQELVRAVPDPTGKRPAERATQEVDDGRWGKGYIFGAFKPADGEVFIKAYDRRTI